MIRAGGQAMVHGACGGAALTPHASQARAECGPPACGILPHSGKLSAAGSSRLPGSWIARAACPTARAAAADAQIDAADRQYSDQSYALALDGYRAVLASGAELGDRRPEVEYRVGVCLGKAGRWDEALGA